MHLMLQQDTPDDFVVATNRTASVEDFLQVAFKEVGIEEFRRFVKFDDSLLRPSEVPYLKGSAAKAKRILKWEPKVYWEGLAKLMVEYDIEHA